MDLNRASELTEEAEVEITQMFMYHEWTQEKVDAGLMVRNALIDAVKIIVQHVPPSADRSVAIRKLRDARMDCNSAITHGGKY